MKNMNGGTPLKFSIANGFFVGELPEVFRDLRTIELRLTYLTCIAYSVVVGVGIDN